jgi:hypothetical protein
MQPPLKQPFTNSHLKILKVLSLNVSEGQLMDLKKNISNFLMDQATIEADKFWEENNWTEETEEELLKTKLRSTKNDKE